MEVSRNVARTHSDRNREGLLRKKSRITRAMERECELGRVCAQKHGARRLKALWNSLLLHPPLPIPCLKGFP